MWSAWDWAQWGNQVKAFFSSKGAILTKFVMANDREMEFFNASMAASDDEIMLEVDGKNLKVTLVGVPVTFTPKLPAGQALFVSKADKDA